MSEQAIDRFEELEAGRILGDLDADEWREWEELAGKAGAAPDFSLELTAAAVETEFLLDQDIELPPALAKALRSDIAPQKPTSAPTPSEPDNVIRPAVWRKALASPRISWGVAALLALLLIATSLREPPATTSGPNITVSGPTEISGEWAKGELLKNAKDLLQVQFGGQGTYNGMSGLVRWSNASIGNNSPTRF